MDFSSWEAPPRARRAEKTGPNLPLAFHLTSRCKAITNSQEIVATPAHRPRSHKLVGGATLAGAMEKLGERRPDYPRQPTTGAPDDANVEPLPCAPATRAQGDEARPGDGTAQRLFEEFGHRSGTLDKDRGERVLSAEWAETPPAARQRR